MSTNYEDLPAQVRAQRRRKARLRAEWAAAEAENQTLIQEVTGAPDTQAIVRMTRRRGRAAETRAGWLFIGLVITILAGLIYYLGLPFFQNYVDGRVLTLRETRAAIAKVEEDLDTRLETVREDLAIALTDAFVRIPVPTGSGSEHYYALMPLDGGRVMVAGSHNTLLIYDPAHPEPIQRIDVPTGNRSDEYRAILPLDEGRVMIAGDDNALLIYDPAQAEPMQRIPLPVSSGFGYTALLPLDEDRVMLAGYPSTLLIYDPAQPEHIQQIPVPIGIGKLRFNALLPLDKGRVMVAGDWNMLLIYDPAKAEPIQRVPAPTGSIFEAYRALKRFDKSLNRLDSHRA
ncbi:hypothetical protein AIOL_000765 [Candidatus Rhodobacter oscarellae]|uniref:Uncharacterized protein n=1 Tax=Candidatus Rhodobacter oscarellae TaxID=1675527 RepID=A0A0J9ED39_9RHOB|nr:hypothetical protein [Candidatus Rhodobacter lobularis]KMW60601.1 hypothetical protein AIOL_000765 [Candidatus Rhodobacter lobularis]